MSKIQLLIPHDEIARRVEAIGEQISRDFAGEPIVLIGVLKGAAIFLADLARHITLDATFDFIAASSYHEEQSSSGKIRLTKDLDASVEKKNVILVEDILDSGFTLNYLHRLFSARNPKRLAVVTLLDKRSRRVHPFTAEYVGFEIPDHFVVGYGMDLAEQYRNLPDICVFPDA